MILCPCILSMLHSVLQMLPFAFDPLNETGSYQTMLASCTQQDGESGCFYRGYSPDNEQRLHPVDVQQWQNLTKACVGDEIACSDTLFAITVHGQGVPNNEKWFWTSRDVYMELEPATLYTMSAGAV
jgi:hypothetical protein